MKHQPILPHACNEPLRCPACVHRFWVWAENYSRRFEHPPRKKRELESESGGARASLLKSVVAKVTGDRDLQVPL